MIIRIVKMVFREEEVKSFQQLFSERKSLIRDFEGCTHLELWQDTRHPQTFFTYSWWDSEAHLNAYRDSDFFEDTWKLTKQKFAAKPEAWSVQSLP
ncbi:MAG: putative quinol monooxygenase [Flavisolibacter sp.]